MSVPALRPTGLPAHRPSRHPNRGRNRRPSVVLLTIVLLLVAFFAWAANAPVDMVTRASGSLIASSRVQVVQSLDGGLLEELLVREGDRVERGDVLARFADERAAASANESLARSTALRATIARLEAELAEAGAVRFPADLKASADVLAAQRRLFEERRRAIADELRGLRDAVRLARQEFDLVARLKASGDISQAEVLRVERLLLDAEAALLNRANRYRQDARTELARARDELSQVDQSVAQRRQVLASTVLHSPAAGIVKNVRVTTRGGVLRPGDELLQIVPSDDRLVLEAKVRPADVALLRPGLPASIKFDAYDYTIHGFVRGTVTYLSADTLREDTRSGEQVYYRVHVETESRSGQVTSHTGRSLDVMPGMTASVDIRTGTRTVLSYLLKPLRRTVDEAFAER